MGPSSGPRPVDTSRGDSSGLDALVHAHNRAHAQGGTVTVRHPNALTQRLLQITGLYGVLIIDPPRPDDN
jgi:anti-anti-sigma regulatory factor